MSSRALLRRAGFAGLLAAMSLSVVAAPAMAGKATAPTTTSTLTLVMVADQNGNGLPNHGDTITWKVSTTATSAPYVSISCTQAGLVVLTANAGYFDAYRWPDARNMILSSPSWTGGAASCSARLYMLTTKGSKTLATSAFVVGA